MAKLKKIDVLHVAKLAKLKLSEKEVNRYLQQLSKVVDYISELSEVKTEGVKVASQTTGLENVYRIDEEKIGQVLKQEEALSGTENTHNGYFKVQAILTGKDDK